MEAQLYYHPNFDSIAALPWGSLKKDPPLCGTMVHWSGTPIANKKYQA